MHAWNISKNIMTLPKADCKRDCKLERRRPNWQAPFLTPFTQDALSYNYALDIKIRIRQPFSKYLEFWYALGIVISCFCFVIGILFFKT